MQINYQIPEYMSGIVQILLILLLPVTLRQTKTGNMMQESSQRSTTIYLCQLWMSLFDVNPKKYHKS